MTKTLTFKLLPSALLTLLLLMPMSTALAYIGPGAGMSVVGSLLTFLATIVVAIGAILFWPLRKWMKRRKARRSSEAGAGPLKADTLKADPVKADKVKSAADKAPDSH